MGYNSMVIFPGINKQSIYENENLGSEIYNEICGKITLTISSGVLHCGDHVVVNCEHADGYSFAITYKNHVINLGSFYYFDFKKVKSYLKKKKNIAVDFNESRVNSNSNLILNVFNDCVHEINNMKNFGKIVYGEIGNSNEDVPGIKNYCGALRIVDSTNPDDITVSYTGMNTGGRLCVINPSNPDGWFFNLFQNIQSIKNKRIYDLQKFMSAVIQY